jgi:hypothetical protein
VKPTVVEDHHVLTVRKGSCEAVQVDLEAFAVQALMLREKRLTRLRLYCSVEIKILVRGLRRLHRLHAWRGDATTRDGHPPDAALVLAKQAHWTVTLQAREQAGKILPKR